MHIILQMIIWARFSPTAGKSCKESERRRLKVKTGVEKISVFIQQATRMTCPDCGEDVLLASADMVIIILRTLSISSALGLKPPPLELEEKDNDPCRFSYRKGMFHQNDNSVLQAATGTSAERCLTTWKTNRSIRNLTMRLQILRQLWMKMINEFTSEVETIEPIAIYVNNHNLYFPLVYN